MKRTQRSGARRGDKEMIRIFYPMVGSLDEYVTNLSRILATVEDAKPSRNDAVGWVQKEFGTSTEFARKVVDSLRRLGLIVGTPRSLFLSSEGQQFARRLETAKLSELLVDRVFGVFEILRVLADGDSLDKSALFERWNSCLRDGLPRNQFEHRLNWLRALGLVDVVARKYYATEMGMKLLSELKIRQEKSWEKRMEISHGELEDRLVVIGQFFEFEATKRPSINAVLPTYAIKLSESDRQLDCLWVRYVHFAGKVKFPIEVHLGGNLADTIDRLETVSDFVQKAILVTTEEQERQVVDRLRVKRSRLLDKLVIITVDDVYKAAEATSILKSFTSKIFVD